MKKISYWLFAALLFAASACTDNEDDDALKADANDIASGVSFGGQQIILADRNFGATEIDGIGAFLTNADAKTACPEGYHLMTKSEAQALIADSRYSTPEKFLTAFHIPYSDYKGTPIVGSLTTRITPPKNMAFLQILNSTLIIDNSDSETSSFYFDTAPDDIQMNLRCVKGDAIVQKSSVSGSIQITGDITMTPKYAGLGITYTDDTKTTIDEIWLVLSSDEPTDEYHSEPEEYVSLYFAPNPTNSGQYMLVSGHYRLPSGTAFVSLFNSDYTTNSTLEYNPSKRSFTLMLDTKDNNATQIAKGSAQGTYIAFPDPTTPNRPI